MQILTSHSRWSNSGDVVKKLMPSLDEFYAAYKDFHLHPELGQQESRTASIVTDFLQSLSYAVEARIRGHGVCGILRNGDGRLILLRADMDALTVKEETNLPYANKGIQKDRTGREVPMMHACGHDMHVASLIAIAKLMVDAKGNL